MTRKHPIAAVLIVALVIGIGPDLRDILEALGTGVPRVPMPYGRSLIYNVMAVAIAVAAAMSLEARRFVARDLGLRWNGLARPALTALSTLPCWLGLAWRGRVSGDFTALDLLFPALVFPLAEELVFRGFGFIFTRKSLGWPIFLCVLVQALVFGLDHWIGAGAQGSVALQVFALTFTGGVFFAALDAMSGYTIWNGWVWHSSVNAAWTVFSVSATAAGGALENALRLVSMALALLLAWLANRRVREPSPSGDSAC
jgi:uncharacterized protein